MKKEGETLRMHEWVTNVMHCAISTVICIVNCHPTGIAMEYLTVR